MLATILLLVGCDDAVAPAVAGPSWHSEYGTCPAEAGTVVVEDLGEPLSLLVEVERPGGWVQLAYSPRDDLSSPTVYRTDDGELVLTCPQGSLEWHVAWASL